MAVVIKKHGFQNIKIFNGGLTDWKRSGLPIASIDPLPTYDGPLLSPRELHAELLTADATLCRDAEGNPLLTLVDFRASRLLHNKIGGDRHTIRTNCPVIVAQLDDFIENYELINSLPKKKTVVCFSETGKRDSFFQRYLLLFGFTNIISLETGMRGWIKAGFPTETIVDPVR
jgi:rhodanese-related sulfurtransferase